MKLPNLLHREQATLWNLAWLLRFHPDRKGEIATTRRRLRYLRASIANHPSNADTGLEPR